LCGAGSRAIAVERRDFTFRCRSPQHFLDIFRGYYGPVLKDIGALDEAGGSALARDILDLIARLNTADNSTMVVPTAYLEAVITRR